MGTLMLLAATATRIDVQEREAAVDLCRDQESQLKTQ